MFKSTTMKQKLAAVLAGLAAVASVAVLQPSSASADTFYGPTGTYANGKGQFPTTDLATGNPTVIHLYSGPNPTGQVLEDAFNSSQPGAEARTWDANGTNAQRVYFQRMEARHAKFTVGVDDIEWGLYPVYRIVHYTAAGKLCLDADASSGAATVGSRVQWVWCHENWRGNPQQLWFNVSTVRQGQTGAFNSLINAGSVTGKWGGLPDLDTAPLLAASANMLGFRTQLTLAPRWAALPTNSVWGFQDVGPGAPPRCTQYLCMMQGV